MNQDLKNLTSIFRIVSKQKLKTKEVIVIVIIAKSRGFLVAIASFTTRLPFSTDFVFVSVSCIS